MKKAYIILAHKDPAGVERLVARLNDGASTFFLHVDKRSPLAGFEALLKALQVHKVKQVATPWGGFGLVAATLEAMQAVRHCGQAFDRIILLSGQDYPIKTNAAIDEVLASSRYENFIDYTSLPDHRRWKPRGGLYRVDKYYFGLGKKRYAAKALNGLALALPFLRRKIPGGLQPYAGSQWWIFNPRALNYILDYVENNKRYVAFHQHSFAPDELFFQMILLNAPDKGLQESISFDAKRFMRWGGLSAAHPKTLEAGDLPAIMASPALFARKFDGAKDSEVLDLIDRYCLKNTSIKAIAANQY